MIFYLVSQIIIHLSRKEFFKFKCSCEVVTQDGVTSDLRRQIFVFLIKFGPRDTNNSTMWPANENSCPPLLWLVKWYSCILYNCGNYPYFQGSQWRHPLCFGANDGSGRRGDQSGQNQVRGRHSKNCSKGRKSSTGTENRFTYCLLGLIKLLK